MLDKLIFVREKSRQRAEKQLPHKALSPMPKMKVGAIQNDEGNGTEKAEVTLSKI